MSNRARKRLSDWDLAAALHAPEPEDDTDDDQSFHFDEEPEPRHRAGFFISGAYMAENSKIEW